MTPGRATRSGREFSLYELKGGPPIIAPSTFNTGLCIAHFGPQDEDAFDREIEYENNDGGGGLTPSASYQPPPLPSNRSIQHDDGGGGYQPTLPPSNRPMQPEDGDGGRALAPSLLHSARSLPANLSNLFADEHIASISSTPIAAVKLTKNQKSNLKKRAARPMIRAAAQVKAGTSVKACVTRHQIQSAKNALALNLLFRKDLAHHLTIPRWIGAREHDEHRPLPPQGDFALEDLLGTFGLDLIDWDGKECRLLTDSENRAFGLLGPMPRDHLEWQKLTTSAGDAFDAARPLLSFPLKNVDHRRGEFPALAIGISHGGGQQQPSVLLQSAHNKPILDALLAHPSLQRIAGFTDCMFRSYAPRLHRFYGDLLDGLHDRDSNLIPPFPGVGVFAACSLNFGPQVITRAHRDYGNLTWGWCAITALGDYDSTKGGHLVLWDLNCVIRFPPGSTIFIPSVLIHHSNATISPGEKRFSFAQYTSGSLFRWASNGFQSEESWLKNASAKAKLQRQEEQGDRWTRGLHMLSTLEEFLSKE